LQPTPLLLILPVTYLIAIANQAAMRAVLIRDKTTQQNVSTGTHTTW